MQQKITQRIRLYFIAPVVLALLANSAQACLVARSEDFNTLQKAKVVVRGKMMSELLFVKSLANFGPHYYRAKVRVSETLSGEPLLNGIEVNFVFYRPVNMTVKGLSKDVEIIVGLREPLDRENTAGIWFVDSSWFSVASPCDSKGVIIVNRNILGDILMGIKGEHKRRN